MPETQRPPLQRKHTRTTEAGRQASLDEGVKITVGGEEYVVKMGDITSVQARRFRREVGVSFMAVVGELSTSPDIDSVAALIWMSRLLRGDDIALEDVAVSYADLDDIEVAEAGAGDVTDPEA